MAEAVAERVGEGASKERNATMKVLTIVSLVLSTVALLLLGVVLLKFQFLFIEFEKAGMELPLLTKTIVVLARLLVLVAAVLVTPLVAVRRSRAVQGWLSRTAPWGTIGLGLYTVGLPVLLIGATLIGAFLPAFQMSDIVNQ